MTELMMNLAQKTGGNAEEALKIEHSILDAVINNIGVGFMVSDKNGQMINMNQAAAEIHGFMSESEGLFNLNQYSEEFSLDSPEGGRVPVEQWPLSLALQGNFVQNYKVVLNRIKSRTYRIISYNTTPVYDASGNLAFIVLTITDLTEIEERTRRLDFERELFEGIFNNIPIMINIYDPEFKKFTFNKEHKKVLGWQETDADDGKLLEKVYPDPEYRKEVTEYMQSLESGWKEWKATAKDGSVVDSVWANIRLKSGIQIGIGIDTRKQNESDNKLRENEKRLQSIFDHAAIGIVETDHEDRLVRVNNRFCEILGYSREELLGKTVMEITYSEDLSKTDFLNASLHEGEMTMFNYEKRYVRKDGKPIWVHISVSSIQDERKNYLKSIGTVEDISERKTAEKRMLNALAEAEESKSILTALMEHIPLGLAIAEAPKIRIRAASKFGVETLDLPAGSVPHYDEEKGLGFYHPDGITQGKVHELPLNRAIRKHEIIINEEWMIKKKDGSLIPILCNAAPVLDNKNRVLGGVVSWQDITDRRKYIEALKQNEEKFRSLFENIIEAVALHEVIYENGKPSGYRLIEANPAYKNCEHNGKSLTQIGPNDELYLEDFYKVAETGKPCRFETFYPDIKKHFIVNVISPRKGQFATVFEDITDQKRTEYEIKQKNEELTRFIYTVSHDLKSPLVTIKSFTEFLKEDIELDDKPAQNKDIQFIQNAADKMGKLLEELLQLSRIGRKEDPKTEVSIHEVIQNALDLLAGGISRTNTKIEVSGPDITVFAHWQRLIQLYQNLIDNAIKFMGNQPDPKIEIGSIFDDNRNEPVLFVKDNGSGIDPRHQHKVFGLFEKLDTGTEGTGIGLALVKRIVDVHNGNIWFKSDGKGKGTTFYFTLEKSRIK